jgi:hypothetical protein
MSYILEKKANLTSKPDKAYNLDNFGNAKEGKKNIMFVGGYSGAGKSTITRNLKKDYKANVIELDDLKRMAFGKFDPAHTGTHPKYQKLMREYIQHNPGLKERMSLYGYNTEYRRFNQFMKDYAKSHPKDKIIMEGIQALGDKDMDIPRYLVGTGAFESSKRAKQRALSLPKGHHYGNPLLLNLGMTKKISKERKAINLENAFKKIEQTNFGPTAKRLLINVAKHPFATSVAAGGTLGGLGLAGAGAVNLLSQKKDNDANKIAMYEEGIYKEAGIGSSGLSMNLSEKALGKISKTKSVADNMLNKYQGKQVAAMQKIDGMNNLLKEQTQQATHATKNSVKNGVMLH